MPHNLELRPGASGYRALGLIADPFLAPDDAPEGDPIGVRLVVHAEAVRLIRAVDRAASEERPKPVLVRKSEQVPSYYHLSALREILSTLAANDDLGLMALYVPLEAVRLGRIRATLNVVAERTGGATFDRTFAAYARDVLVEPDETLPEFEPIKGVDLAALRDALEVDPIGTVEAWLGPCVGERVPEELEQLMRTTAARQSLLESEPSETDSVPEEETEGEVAKAFEPDFASLSPVTSGGAPQPTLDDLIADYLIAHTKAHLSPVVARGLRAYRASGTSALAQELKITKAPKKTLRAILSFLGHRFRRVVLIYDRFEAWPFMPEDLKPRILSMLTELRWVTEGNGQLVLLTAPGVAPEVEEQFAAATTVDWTMDGLSEVERPGSAVDAALVTEWVAAASLDGPTGIGDDTLERLINAAGGDLERFSALAHAAVGEAAARGAEQVDEAAIEHALASALGTEGS